MPVLDAACQVERLREVAGCDSGHAVQIMPPPSYLQALLYEGNACPDHGLSADVVLVYKVNNKSSTSSLPFDVREGMNVSIDSSVELGGDPLPAPFDDAEFEVSLSEQKQYQWPKGELNHLPLRTQEALDILNKFDCTAYKNPSGCDIWCLVDGGISKDSTGAPSETQNNTFNANHSADADEPSITNVNNGVDKVKKKSRILVGVHVVENCWTRSFVETQGMCSIASPEMNPEFMKKSHLDIARMPAHTMNAAVLCRYNLAGQRLAPDVLFGDNASSVTLELKWRQPSFSVPLQDSSAKLLVQSVVGHTSSPAYDLWKQLCTLHKLFELLFTCWRDKTTPELLPHLDPLLDDTLDGALPQEFLENRLKTFVMGGKQALQAQTANRRMSIAPALLGRESIAPGRQSMAPNGSSVASGFLNRISMAPQMKKETSDDFEIKNCSLSETLELAAAGNRENSDFTDGLFSLLIGCKTYRELVSAWDLTFMELSEAQGPYVRPKNSTRAAKLIQSFLSGQCVPDFMEMEGSLFSLELLIELGLEKLTTDYYYIFLKSQLVGREELQAPQLVRAMLGVPKDKWLASCGQLLGWLAQVHCALEIVLPLENSLSSLSVSCMASKALKHFQSESSPIRSVAGLLTPRNSLQEFSLTIIPEAVQEHIKKDFDFWRMTLTSENRTRKVRSVFLRNHLRPIFPPQLYEHSETLIPVEGTENDRFYCAEAVTISQKF